MWDKIGELLGYPTTWCSLIIRFTFAIYVGLLLVFVLVSPLVIYILEGATGDFYVVTTLVSFVYYGIHSIAKDEFSQYREFLDKLPSCPKINWDKGE